MTNIRCFIVDDEPIAVGIIDNYLQRLEGFQVEGTFTNPIKAFEALQQTRVDLLFLDIQMPELTGLELLSTLRHRPDVVFTTAYRDFAPEGFDLDAVDYLLKPVSFERFLKAIDKFRARMPRNRMESTLQVADAETGGGHLFVRADRKNIRVNMADILYLESLRDYVRIVTAGGKITTKETIAHFETVLPVGQFLRVHRSYIVAKDKITALSADGLEVGKHLIPVGRMYKLMVEKAVLG
ncbi:MAG: response regulator transcription factor [Saprospiraceae bacterium]|jgi:DNA-binding LytR/AlgR family response regulator|nr:response regulator transcription factor [Saprospiraceae bacterium]